jgi:hypothetical protein
MNGNENVVDLELVWPLHRSHYLNVPDPERERTVMAVVDVTSSPPLVVTPGRELAVRALLAGPDCTQRRVSDLLGVSRRTTGRLADAESSTALRDPQVLETARTYLAETASRGSTAKERAAAVAWLEARTGVAPFGRAYPRVFTNVQVTVSPADTASRSAEWANRTSHIGSCVGRAGRGHGIS